ncbi:cation-translocating P-type ATPase [Evansella sp. AB-P1]|uniref:cation-translocating P-type ATPase n=1 Tax=Evansella sp. AB-P1 TaxID=3037653 RepID=UPI002420377A|nr:cation-translocating P-type ATPase [Evansella sp. AB-P1]MDG5788800.1 cation-translocating P-type ATPase [Evansella sp. AB-P1]
MIVYQKAAEEVLSDIHSSKEGLSKEEAFRRLERDGYNEIGEVKKASILQLFLESFKDAMVVVLLIAAGVQLVLGEYVESIIIFIVLVMNAIISVVQTKKAESSLDALRKMSAPTAKVIRNGVKETIPARELVPGDIVLLEAGDYVPADGRIIENSSLKVNEGMLTGESEAVSKEINIISEEVTIGDRLNMVFSSSLVVYGRATVVVSATGLNTEIGKIADMLQRAEAKQTPLQRKLDVFSKKLGIAILVLSIFIFLVEVSRIWLGPATADTAGAILSALMFAVAVAVAAIPEALQSIVTIVLSVGTHKMAKRHAIIRKLPAVETLGSTSVICTDKTGTLTQNKMTVMEHFNLGHYRVSLPEKPQEWTATEAELMNTAILCNDSSILQDGKEIGDPTEVALVRFANKKGYNVEQIRNSYPRIGELPFDSDRKRMSTLHEVKGKKRLYIKGGPDVVLSLVNRVYINGEVQPLTKEYLNQFNKANEDFSEQALRVLAFAYKDVDKRKYEVGIEDEQGLVLVGLLAMIDPPRDEVYDSIAQAKDAGIRTVMITGDHKTTAQAIAREIGIMENGDVAVTGMELDQMSDEELDERLEHISVYARVSPENKIRIVRHWQKKNQITAMTGDGVNDAPALKQADIGIGMGSGTDVAKDASAMILTDDNFVSIVNAVSVGRTVFDNIKKAISYLFAGNLGAIIAILFAVVMNWANPFTALQLLFINLVNDSLPAIALGMEKEEPDVMKRKPRKMNEGIFTGKTLRAVVIRGTLIGIAVIISHYIGLQHSDEMGVAMAFTTLILTRTLQTLAARSTTQTIFGVGFFTNKYVLGALLFCFTLYSITIMPFARDVFAIPEAFGFNQWLIAAGLSVAAVIVMDLTKLIGGWGRFS